MTQLAKNKVIIACAGSGKTTFMVEEALKLNGKRILITTYTNENIDQIETFFVKKASCVPVNVTVQSWFSFLLHEGVRPYQNQMTLKPRVRSICFQPKPIPGHKKDNYITAGNDIYSNKASEFAVECNKKTAGIVINRMEKMFDYIFIDEMQDLAGYDLELLEILFDSKIFIVAVGDPRQATYSTNNAQKNKQHRRSNIYSSWLKSKKISPKVTIVENINSFRCNQKICDFADALFPELPKTVSKNTNSTGHDGIFTIKSNEVGKYYDTHSPIILRWNKNVDTFGFPAINIGLSKGRTYNRVLIFPTKPMIEYLKTKDITKVGDKSKLYVAVTRARHSVAFVSDDDLTI